MSSGQDSEEKGPELSNGHGKFNSTAESVAEPETLSELSSHKPPSVASETLADGNEDQSSSSDDEEEEDEPPRLKYTRITQLPPTFFTKDPVSTCTFHESYFIFATHSGTIHITTPTFERVRTFKAHRASVLSVYCDGTYFASGSMDGTVVVGSIRNEKDITAYDFHRPIHAVVLDKSYSKTGGFVYGGMSGKVVYSSKSGWLGKRQESVLDQGNGPIVSIQLVDDLLFWMNDNGITICQLSARKVVKKIEKPADSPRSDLYWPRVTFPETNRILIAWGNHIWSLKVSISVNGDSGDETSSQGGAFSILPSSASMSFRGPSIYAHETKVVEIEHIYKVDSLISGISSFKDDLWMILTYEPPTEDTSSDRPHRIFNNPELKIINSANGEVEFEEEVGLRDVQGLGLNDYILGTSHIASQAPSYFIVSAKDGVLVQEYQVGDRLNWYLDHEKYYEAWSISLHLVSRNKRLGFGVQYLDGLVKNEEWSRAGQFLAELLVVNDSDLAAEADSKSTVRSDAETSLEQTSYVEEVVKQWNIWGEIFIKSNHIPELTAVIPTKSTLSLHKSIYNQILEYWIDTDVPQFIELIANWDHEVYDIKKVQSIIEPKLEESDNSELRRCLCQLYVKSVEPTKAVKHLIKLRDQNIMAFLSEHHILKDYKNQWAEIISLRFEDNEFETLPIDTLSQKVDDIVDILVSHRFEIPPHEVIEVFDSALGFKFLNYLYLEKIDDPSILSDERIKLYSQYNRSKLLRFLARYDDDKSGSGYNIDSAIAICRENDFIEELVYLLGKIGESKQALELIIDRMDNPEMAIKFAKTQNDGDLWGVLIEYSMKKPKFVRALIEDSDEQSHQFYDPVQILQKMDPSIKVPGLSGSIIKFTHKNDLNLLINQGILRIVYKQAQEVSERFRQEKSRGREFDELKSSTYKGIVVSREIQEVPAGKVFTTIGDKVSLLQQINDGDLTINDI